MKQFLNGCKLAIPIIAGYFPLGFACGVISVGVGMSVFQVVLMSILVFAGAGQYIAAGMIGVGAPVSSIIITTLIVNIRHALYNSALYPHVSHWSFLKKSLFAYEITDETFGLHSSILSKGAPINEATAFGINISSHMGWVFGNFLGALSGSLLGDYKVFGFDFALPALFIGLLVPRLSDKPQLSAALVSGIVAILCAVNGVSYWGIIIAAVAGATVGLFMSGVKDA